MLIDILQISVARSLIVVLFTCILVGGMFELQTVEAQNPGAKKCAKQVVCVVPFCEPMATTLPSVDPESGDPFSYGFRAATSSCGATTCWIIFPCQCGPPLGAPACSNLGANCGGELKGIYYGLEEPSILDGRSFKKMMNSTRSK